MRLMVSNQSLILEVYRAGCRRSPIFGPTTKYFYSKTLWSLFGELGHGPRSNIGGQNKATEVLSNGKSKDPNNTLSKWLDSAPIFDTL